MYSAMRMHAHMISLPTVALAVLACQHTSTFLVMSVQLHAHSLRPAAVQVFGMHINSRNVHVHETISSLMQSVSFSARARDGANSLIMMTDWSQYWSGVLQARLQRLVGWLYRDRDRETLDHEVTAHRRSPAEAIYPIMISHFCNKASAINKASIM
jgi:hypothetical protein